MRKLLLIGFLLIAGTVLAQNKIPDNEVFEEIGRLHITIIQQAKQIRALTEQIVTQQKEIEALKNPTPKP